MSKQATNNEKKNDDEEMIDTNINKDQEMEEEKQPQMLHKPSIDTHSEMLKSETNDPERSEMSEQYEFDPFFGRT